MWTVFKGSGLAGFLKNMRPASNETFLSFLVNRPFVFVSYLRRERDREKVIKEYRVLRIPTCLDYLTVGDHGICKYVDFDFCLRPSL